MTGVAGSIAKVTTRPNASSRLLDLDLIPYQAAAIMIAFTVPTIAAMALDDRSLNDVSVWDKPLRFEIALFIHLLTIGLVSRILGVEMAAKRIIRSAYVVSAVAAVGETAYIVLQAARARQSHFNFDTPVESFMYGMMGVGATALVMCAFVIGLGVLKGGDAAVGAGLRAGAAWRLRKS